MWNEAPEPEESGFCFRIAAAVWIAVWLAACLGVGVFAGLCAGEAWL